MQAMPMQQGAGPERSWSNDFFDCFSACGTCCLATWCPCMVYQQVKNRLDHMQRAGRPDPERGGSGCGGDCCLYGTLTACCGLGWIFQVHCVHLNLPVELILTNYDRSALVQLYALGITSPVMVARTVLLLLAAPPAISPKNTESWMSRKVKYNSSKAISRSGAFLVVNLMIIRPDEYFHDDYDPSLRLSVLSLLGSNGDLVVLLCFSSHGTRHLLNKTTFPQTANI